MSYLLFLYIFALSIITANSFLFSIRNVKSSSLTRNFLSDFSLSESPKEDFDETTKKYGLEVGLWKSLRSKDKDAVKPQDLLKKYGIAYLATSITLAIISYATCFFLVSNGVDVAALLDKIGIKATAAASNAGTAGIAYAVHKAASPIRFPPTVALTPIVAKWIGKEPQEKEALESK